MTDRKTRPSAAPTGEPAEPAQRSALVDDTEGFTPIEETAPVSVSPHLLNESHALFCAEYAKDLNATRAYMRAYPHAMVTTAGTEGHRLLKNPAIRLEVQRLLDERATLTGITADRVLLRLWETATADPREIVEMRVGACRHCWGTYGQYQYTDGEWEKALSDHVHAEAKRAKAEKDDFVPRHCPPKGGTGYTPNRQPNPDCGECHGDGEPRAILKDTRNLSAGALAIFGGVKTDKDGRMSVVIRDQLPALRMVAEHLGLLSDKLPGPSEKDALTALLEDIRGRHGAGSALAVVQQDPERRLGAMDVESREVPATEDAASPASKPRSKWKPVE